MVTLGLGGSGGGLVTGKELYVGLVEDGTSGKITGILMGSCELESDSLGLVW